MRSTVVNVIGLALAVSVVAALILAAVTKKVFHIEIEISAPPEAVWAVLTDTERYAEWNPTQVEVRGAHAVGSQLAAVFDAPEIKPFEVQLTVIEMDSPRLLRQGGGVPGIITFDHRWMISPTSTDRLLFSMKDGNLPALLGLIDRACFNVSEALRARVIGLRAQEIRSNNPD